MKNIIKDAVLNALGTAVYIVLVVYFISKAPQIFGDGNSLFIPILMLMLFVFSAALTGTLVFGKPVLWYLDGKRKDAVSLLVATLAVFLLVTAGTFFAFYVKERAPSKIVAFNCEEGKSIRATFYPKSDTEVKLSLSDGRKLTLPHAISASGARYANQDETIVFWNKGNTAFMTEGSSSDKTYSNCVLGESN